MHHPEVRVERLICIYAKLRSAKADARLMYIHVIKRNEVGNRKMLRAVVVVRWFPRASGVLWTFRKSEIDFQNELDKRSGRRFFDFTDRVCTRSPSHLRYISHYIKVDEQFSRQFLLDWNDFEYLHILASRNSQIISGSINFFAFSNS